MNIADSYRLLGLRTGATHEDIKAAYRKLARQLHPDMNPEDDRAKERFIRITEAYQFLLGIIAEKPPDPTEAPSAEPQSAEPPKVTIKVTHPQTAPELSLIDRQLLQTSYEQLQDFFKLKKFPRAIALVEGLAQRFPDHPDVRQWQAITYHRWAQHLIQERNYEKARLYLKKALRTDPHNRRLWAEIDQDFRRLEERVYRRR
ncbi:DnaJ domain-containing protein [Cyanobacteria bacterium FACHB-DQ100]|uniref:DnaJ domain-containing protein n=1 Tax=Leptolyngbya sp. DQ-M1 TaxID=2933920 RepID=UPI0019C81D70|nr:DnaJ domain-containing protein [Cyanobacteria bacterium FACHB-DQ100]